MSDEAIEYLGWLPMSRRLRASVERAVEHASTDGSAEILNSHLLRAFDEDVDVNVYLARCGAPKGRIASIGAGSETGGETADEDGRDRVREAGEPRLSGSAMWDRVAEDPYSETHIDRAPSGYGRPTRSPVFSRVLRRLMANSCVAAERLGLQETHSELVLQVLAVDAKDAVGAQIAALLPQEELARLQTAFGSDASVAASASAGCSVAVGGEPSFKLIEGQIEALLMRLHGELQKDMRYRIANDLGAYVTQTRPGEEALQNSALPILHATRAELGRDAHFLAMERIRATLRSVRAEEGQVRAALAGLAREGRLESGGALADAAAKLVELPNEEAMPPQAECSQSDFDNVLMSEAPSLQGPALVHAARRQASPWEGLAKPPLAVDADGEPEQQPSAAEGPEAVELKVGEPEPEMNASPLFGRVFKSVRSTSMFSRRRSGAA